MLSDGGDRAAAGATAQPTANTKEDATDTAHAQQCSELVHTESGKEPAIWQTHRLTQATANWLESEARNRKLERALMQLVRATRAMAARLGPGQDISNLVGLANRLAETNWLDEADADDNAGADSDDEAGAASTGAASVGDSVGVGQWMPLEKLVEAGLAAPSDLQGWHDHMAARGRYAAAGADSAGNSDDDSDDDGQFVHCGKKPRV